MISGLDVDVDEHAGLRPGTRVEALKAGTQGTWYVARIVESATFPPSYISDPDSEETPNQEYPMVCVHYEGIALISFVVTVADFRIFSITISLDSPIFIADDVQ